MKVLSLQCGQHRVAVGAAPARELYSVSFADVLNEDTEEGYQRPFDPQHSREFRTYIEQPGATTIPLTFNLRGAAGEGWKITASSVDGYGTLAIRRPSPGTPPVLAQVDCQHRLGMMGDSSISLTFQCYLGLSPKEEMAIFNTINSKAKGLNPSLLDYHTSKLIPDLDAVQLDLFIAKTLHDDHDSVWCGLVKMGGAETQGSHRRTSLRGLQSATKVLLQRSPLAAAGSLTSRQKYEVVRSFWNAVAIVWERAWSQPRTHLLIKGVGVTALSLLGADIITAAVAREQALTIKTFTDYLDPLASLDWSASGVFKGYGGRQGANQAHQMLRARLFAPGLAAVRRA
jgi:DNA sulfur modification protein DndB